MTNLIKRLAELDSANPTRPEGKVTADRNITALREVRDGAYEFSTTILNPAFIDWENGNGDENNPPEETLEVRVTYDVSGSYRPATWGDYGGDPEEYPELEVMSVYDENTGQEISDRLDKATLDDINDKAWEDAEDQRNNYDGDVYEGKEVAECGGMSPMGASHTPASLNITANSGEELSSMLRDIMQLAGAHKVEPDELSQEPVGSTVSPAQAIAVGTSDAEDMRSVMDKLNPMDDEEETDEARDIDYGAQDGGPEWERAKDFDDYPDDYPDDDEEETDEGAVYNNTPTDPNNPPAFDSEEFAHHENPPGAARGRGNFNNPRATTMEQVEKNLFSEYRKFIREFSDFPNGDIAYAISRIHPYGGNRQEYMKLVAKEIGLNWAREHPEEFKNAFDKEYDKFYGIEPDNDEDADYTDYSMRQGEMGNPDRFRESKRK